MTMISKKEIKKIKQAKIQELIDKGLMFPYVGLNTYGSPKQSRKTGKIINQKGAFGRLPKPSIDGEVIIYETFSESNHDRFIRNKAIAKARRNIAASRIKAPMAQEL